MEFQRVGKELNYWIKIALFKEIKQNFFPLTTHSSDWSTLIYVVLWLAISSNITL